MRWGLRNRVGVWGLASGSQVGEKAGDKGVTVYPL